MLPFGHILISASVMETSEISLRLEQFDDIFSDFDIRPYAKRALSVDFLEEIKRAANDKTDEGIELILHVPKKARSRAQEEVIRERLSAHFKRHYLLLVREKRRVMVLGIGMVLMGIISMIAATFIVSEGPSENLFMSFLLVFLEPAAWFLLWEGMDQIIFNSKNIQPELDFYRKMSNAHGKILFSSY